MKHIYFIAAAVVALSANADIIPLPDSNLKIVHKEGTNTSFVKADFQKSSHTRKAKANADVATAAVSGEYSFKINDIYYETSKGELLQDGTLEVEGNVATLNCTFFPTSFNCAYDEDSATLSFTKQALGQYELSNGSVYYIRVEPFFCDYDAERFVNIDYEVTFDEETLSFEFPENHGFMWVAYINEDYDNKASMAGIVGIFDVISMTKTGGWTFYDNASYVDGWIIPAFGLDQYMFPWSVEVEQSDLNPNVFRIPNPYLAYECLVADYAEEGGCIIFDISDPDHVAVLPGYFCGMTNDGKPVQNTNQFGYDLAMSEGEDVSYEQLIEWLEEEGVNFSTYDQESATINFNDCRIQLNGEGCSEWMDQAGNLLGSKMNGRLRFLDKTPDVQTSVKHESADVIAPEYFNLQGVRVSEPHHGLYIVKNGSTAKKVMM